MLIEDGENSDEVPYMPTNKGESLANDVPSMTHNPDTMLIEFWKISELSRDFYAQNQNKLIRFSQPNFYRHKIKFN
ncbi:hypothetical protein MJO28_011194 [Puccinia striiformis f. sp. tritici]|uniref:Uncharacterized protein n=1 Tax=Puccinia striiformis f. sp. tritici TaxID=168172 RepID=A0ACC0E2P5_9BASI|nr:hypothetical protein MJO28_011194 [Puccinia striiformis f. sp. tritici]